MFEQWKKEGKETTLVAGAWCRPLFVGGWYHSDSHTERTFNLQTPTIFIDLRIPRIDFAKHKSLSSMTDSELSLFARRHCFSGYSVVNDGRFPRLCHQSPRPSASHRLHTCAHTQLTDAHTADRWHMAASHKVY